MSPVGEVLARIQDIRTTLQQLQQGTTPAASSAASSARAGAFAQALSAAGPSATAPAASSPSSGVPAAAAAPGATGVPGATLPTAGDATGEDVVAAAKRYLGVPYVFGGEDSSGMDCSGLVQRVFADLGIEVPRVVPDQARLGTEVASLAEARPGDLVVSRGTGHIAIWLGDGKLLHAPRPGKDVQIVDNYLKDSDVTTIRRLLPPERSVAAAAAPAGTDLATAALQRLLAGGGAL
ncbi:C40 family peptidase [Frigoribacterium salinisoli]